MKYSKVLSSKSKRFENVVRRGRTMTINFMQEITYELDCGHRWTDCVSVEKQPKSRMKCPACRRIVEGPGITSTEAAMLRLSARPNGVIVPNDKSARAYTRDALADMGLVKYAFHDGNTKVLATPDGRAMLRYHGGDVG